MSRPPSAPLFGRDIPANEGYYCQELVSFIMKSADVDDNSLPVKLLQLLSKKAQISSSTMAGELSLPPTVPPTIITRFTNYLLPSGLMVASILFLLYTAITCPKLVITDFHAYRNLAFARFFTFVGPKLSEDIPSAINDILATSRGVILDIGPGAGHQLYRFSRPDQIEMAYGAEPGVDMHAVLSDSAKKAGLGNKYHILACGAEPETLVPALAKEGLLSQGSNGGVFDEIVSIRVLCGVPKPKETVDGLYRLLKPGGRLVVFEHIVNDPLHGGAWSARVVQQLYMLLGWKYLLGDCHLTRDTTAMVQNAARGDGGWASVKLEVTDAWSVIPHLVGYCVKK